MSNELKISRLFDDIEFSFQDASFDKALIGTAQKLDRVLPMYSWRAAKSILSEEPPVDVYRRLQPLLESRESLILHTLPWRELWSWATIMELPRYDQLDKAVVGYGEDSEDGYPSLVYNLPLATNLIARSQDDSTISNSNQSMFSAGLFLERRVLTLDLGYGSPWFLTPV